MQKGGLTRHKSEDFWRKGSTASQVNQDRPPAALRVPRQPAFDADGRPLMHIGLSDVSAWHRARLRGFSPVCPTSPLPLPEEMLAQ